MLAEDIYMHMEVKELLPWKQKGSRKRNRARKDQVMIDKLIVKYFKSKLKLDSWIVKCLVLFCVDGDVWCSWKC